MKKLLFSFKVFVILALGVFMAACSNTAYNKGVDANIALNTRYANTQDIQLETLQLCYMYSKDTSHCSVVAAGTNAVQVLGGRPAPIRIAKSPGEIAETIATRGFTAAVQIYGIKQVSESIQALGAGAGKVEVLRPEVVRPEIVNPVIVTP